MKKIMFNDKYGLTMAVLEGRKTQTRRIVPQSVIEKYAMLEDPTIIDDARYEIGDIVAIAQSYNSFYNDECNPVLFPSGAGWTNKMYVKPELMPHQIRITDVRVERLQDISDECCLKEGVVVNEPKIKGGINMYYPCEYLRSCAKEVGWGRVFHTPREAFAYLINNVSRKGTWESNPYVFVYDFELVK